AKCFAHLLTGLEAVFWILGQGLADDGINAGRQPRIDHRGRRRILVNDLIEYGGYVAFEWLLTGKEFVENRAKREDVAAMVNLPIRGLLRSHVAGRSYHEAGLGKSGIFDLSDTEIPYFNSAQAGPHQVGRRQIAMHYVTLVSDTNRLADLVCVQQQGPQLR